ncbi:peptidoglycan D,D-transpeptidase FtsI family protein [Bacillus testis]|uniref:peptidoglycan D,D-transpeptidase FtsI family protein n=1 Tax=Bacillus testis TaxID=1622072 RepID=UPI000B09A141|nr:penicillin-binding protein 2 [Bacillus testis]
MAKKNKNNSTILRLNLLFVTVFILFSAIILRLGFIQIVKGDEFLEKSNAVTKTTYKWNAPRGKIYDRGGNVLVENEPIYTLTYSEADDTSKTDTLETAKKLSSMLTIDTSKVRDRDKKDYWILLHPEEAQKKVSDKEREGKDDKEQYHMLLDRITDEDIASITPKEMQIYTIKSKMDQDHAGVNRIKEGLTDQEIAVVNEHLDELPGIDVKLDSKRKYKHGDTFKQIFGKVAAIPLEKADEYKKQGYDMDDNVGKSFLELQYESILQGTKEKQTFEKNSSGELTGSSKKTEGSTGKDVLLTIDMDLQKKVDSIVESELRKEPSAKGAYVVLMNPKTGEVLSLSGKSRNDGKIEDETYGTLQNSYEMGSTVKGATLLTGYNTGAIKPGQIFLDAPVKLSGTPVKKSWTNMGYINDLTALERSSNVYMFHVAMKIGHYNYDTRSGFKNPEEAYDKMRKHFAQFGLGVKTGIDLPNEATGYNGGVQRLGNLMDFAIGQFDTYTPLQLAQYVSTIANDGKRMQPHLLKEVREPSHETGKDAKTISTFEPVMLNKLPMSESQIKRVQEGFHLVMHGSQGTATSSFQSASYDPAGKTGTAQVSNGRGGYNYNLTLVGYAPFKNPEISMAVVVNNINSSSSVINKNIGRQVMDAYFEGKEKQKKAEPLSE